MVIALARPKPKTSQSDIPCEFLTGKELDPDFVDFNSVNRKYHFPYRSYVPYRASFSTVDPLLLSRSLKKARPSIGALGSPLLPQAEAIALPTREDLLDSMHLLRQLKLPLRVLEELQRVIVGLPSRARRSKNIPIPVSEIIRFPYVYAIHRPTAFVDPAGLQEAMSGSEADELARRESEAPDLQEFRGGALDLEGIRNAIRNLPWPFSLFLGLIFDAVECAFNYVSIDEGPQDPDTATKKVVTIGPTFGKAPRVPSNYKGP